MENILLIQTAFIGDVVLALPVAQVLKKHYPEAELHFVVQQGTENLLKNHPAIDHVWLHQKSEHKNRSLYRLVSRLKKRPWDLAINIHRFFSTGLLMSMVPATTKIGFDKNPLSYFYDHTLPHQIPHPTEDGNYLHEVERNLQLLQPLNLEEFHRPRLYPSEHDEQKLQPHLETPNYVIAPASVWHTKQWPQGKWSELVSQIDSNYYLYFIGGPDDRAFCADIARHHPQTTNFCGELTFLQSAALMQHTEAVLTNDSAPLHFASAMNVPTLAIFCSTVPRFGFGPLADKAAIIEINTPLSCRPCGLHGHDQCPQGHFKCARDIASQRILQQLAEWRNARSS
jgi:heptosyltransferase-2